ncbi:MAG: hypothetical protein VKJ64_17070 [Leptolyngbyaceae bacterium]|nr:hypothetical protein [Leptolyngbyaceae bacterium]
MYAQNQPNANQPISDLIEEVIQKRQPLARRITEVINQVKIYQFQLSEIQEHRNGIKDRTHDPVVLHNLSDLDFSQLSDELKQHLNTLKNLKRRFSRETFNLGVVGRARQGKSHLLCRLSGLDPDPEKGIIPTGKGGDCTGTRIKIFHTKDSDVVAWVYPHTEESFLKEVIAPYYEKLQPSVIPSNIGEFHYSFTSIPIPDDNQASLKAMYEHLNDYHKHLNKYSSLLSKSPFQIGQEKIREHVAQNNHNGTEKYYNYLAIKEVVIHCSFPHEDFGKIGLVDMPGLGDTTAGEDQRLIKTLASEIDIILFVRMPNAMTGDDWRETDTILYENAAKAISDSNNVAKVISDTDLKLSPWSFMILNHYNRELNNLKLCEDFLDNISYKGISVARTFICDCNSELETGQSLVEIIKYMLEQDPEQSNGKSRIEVLDDCYSKKRQTDLLDWERRYHQKLEKARSALDSYRKKNINRKFDELWENLCNNLRSLKKEAKAEVNKPDKNFEEQVKAAISESRRSFEIPSEEEILRSENLYDSLRIAYGHYINAIRPKLSKCFFKLDGAVQKSLTDEKNRIIHILREDVSLKNISKHQDIEFLKELNTLIPNDLTELQDGFTYLLNFNVAYAAIIQKNLRSYIDELHADKKLPFLSNQPSHEELINLNRKLNFIDESVILSQSTDELIQELKSLARKHNDDESWITRFGLNPEELRCYETVMNFQNFEPDFIRSSLENFYNETINSCEKQLSKLLSEPNQLRYTMVAEFVDRMLTKEARTEWFDFLDNDAITDKVWSDFKKVNRQIAEKKRWIELIDSAIESSNKQSLIFLDF